MFDAGNDPLYCAIIAWRMSKFVADQISPSACTCVRCVQMPAWLQAKS